jgi:hypothetical protein
MKHNSIAVQRFDSYPNGDLISPVSPMMIYLKRKEYDIVQDPSLYTMVTSVLGFSVCFAS